MKRLMMFLFMIVSAAFPTLTLMGCYGIQDSYDYKPVNVDPHLHMSAWEFIEARQDVFSFLKQAIEHVDQAYPGFKDLYAGTESEYTYMFLDNKAFTAVEKDDDDGDGIFVITGTGSQQVEDIPVDVLRDILLYHIVDGYYHSLSVSGSLNFDPINVITLWRNSNSVMTLCLNSTVSRLEFSRLVVNMNAGNSTSWMAVTSNLIATNGVIHVFSKPLRYRP